jgi:hypothetical protein
MEEKRQYHFKKNEMKTSAIEFVLENEEPVSEPDIIKYLKGKYGVSDRATINRHLKDLKELGCLELKPPVKKGLSNYWRATKINTLKNIREKFPDILLNKYEKTLNIVLQEQANKGFIDKTDSIEAHRLRVQFLLSKAFFEKCLEIGIGCLYGKAYDIDPWGEDFAEDSYIEQLVDELYTKFIKKIPITSDITNLEIQISKEKLEEILAAVQYNLEFGPSNISTSRSVNNFLTSITAELHSKFVREIPGNFLLSNKIYHEISINVNDAFEQNADELETILYKINIRQYTSRKFVPDTIFQHFFESDVIEGVASREEKRFVRETKRVIRLNKEKDPKPELRNELDKFYVEYFNECKKTS